MRRGYTPEAGAPASFAIIYAGLLFSSFPVFQRSETSAIVLTKGLEVGIKGHSEESLEGSITLD